jgi:hypothetical protein
MKINVVKQSLPKTYFHVKFPMQILWHSFRIAIYCPKTICPPSDRDLVVVTPLIEARREKNDG